MNVSSFGLTCMRFLKDTISRFGLWCMCDFFNWHYSYVKVKNVFGIPFFSNLLPKFLFLSSLVFNIFFSIRWTLFTRLPFSNTSRKILHLFYELLFDGRSPNQIWTGISNQISSSSIGSYLLNNFSLHYLSKTPLIDSKEWVP